ncbi:MAG: GYD domain-containing protein [Chloroflexota bacterium]
MPGYIILGKWTEKGAAEVKNSPERMKQARAAAEKMGGKVVGMWVTMGQYDGVIVLDMPNEQAASLFALGMARQGAANTQTMRAYSEDEFAQLVAKLP